MGDPDAETVPLLISVFQKKKAVAVGAPHPSVQEVVFVKKGGTKSWQAAEGAIKGGTHVSRLERSPGETLLNQKPAAGIRSSLDPTTVLKCEGLMSVCLC